MNDRIIKASSDIGRLIVVSGPSGVGKGTVIVEVLKKVPNLIRSTSATTRKPRPQEQEGCEYFFKSEDQFKQLIQDNAFLEWAQYAGNYYGTLKEFVTNKQKQGLDVILEIEVQGAKQIKQIDPEIVLIFISPPDFHTLETRLRNRATESLHTIETRLDTAKIELESRYLFDYEVINENLDEAVNDLLYIIKAQRLRIHKR